MKTSLILPVFSKKPRNDQNGSFLRNGNFSTKDSWFQTSSLTETKLYFESNCISYQNYVTEIGNFKFFFLENFIFQQKCSFLRNKMVWFTVISIRIRLVFWPFLKISKMIMASLLENCQFWNGCDTLKAYKSDEDVKKRILFELFLRKFRFLIPPIEI